MYKLRIEKGPEEGKTLPIPEDGLALGRSSQNDVAIRDEMLSRRHCRFYFEDGAPMVADLATVNGTQVNGVSIQEATRLRPGDAVAIGVSLLRLSDENGGRIEFVDLFAKALFRLRKEIAVAWENDYFIDADILQNNLSFAQ